VLLNVNNCHVIRFFFNGVQFEIERNSMKVMESNDHSHVPQLIVLTAKNNIQCY